MEIFYMILGIFMLYTIGHFFVIQHNYSYKNRNTYERFVTISAIICIILLILGSMS